MTKAAWWLAVLLTTTSLARAQQTEPAPVEAAQRPAVTAQATATTIQAVAAMPQKWAAGAEIVCRASRELPDTYTARLNTRLQALGDAGWELVSIALGPDLGAAKQGATDCLVVAVKRPLAAPRQ